MQRDMELVREILLAIQSRQDLTPKEIKLDGRDDTVVGHHVEMLYHAGFIDGIFSRANNKPYADVHVRDLSWDGHDFIGALENQTVWGNIKQKFSAAELATLPLTVIKNVGLAMLNEWAMQKAGLGC